VSHSVNFDVHPSNDVALPHCYSILARAEVSVLPRVLELFVKRGMLPRRCHSTVGGPAHDDLEIDLQVDGLEAETADHIQRCLAQIVHVDRVLMSRAHRYG
jgi:acetolactate synthase small subunit